MAKQVIWAPQAVADRLHILAYWRQRLGAGDYSFALDRMFRESVALLAEYPELGREIENNKDVRVFVKDQYQIFYRNRDKTIEILHVWDSRRDPEDLNLK